jgi:hypothetical protein
MIEYRLSDEDRKAMAVCHRQVQAALTAIANERLGTAPELDGVFKWEGGVRVARRDVVIHLSFVRDNGGHAATPTPEEQAVVDSIAIVAEILRKEGPEGLATYRHIRRGDPLRAMFGFKTYSVE